MTTTQKLESLSLAMIKKLDQKLSYVLEELVNEKQHSTISIRKPNTPAIWGGLAPSSEYRTVNSFAQGDIHIYRDADGHLRIQPAVSRIRQWAPRHLLSTKLAVVSHVFLQTQDRMIDGNVEIPMGMIRVLGAYRVLAEIFRANGLDRYADFSMVRLHICSSDAQLSQAFFCGTQQASELNAKPTKFVFKYEALNMVLGMKMPNELLDNTVVQCFDPIEVEAHMQTARALASQSVRSFSLDEALSRFGHLVPEIDAFDATLDLETRVALGVPMAEDPVDDTTLREMVIDFGDGSFRID